MGLAVLTNRERLTNFMRGSDIEAVVSWSPVNVRYLTGYWCWLAPLLKEYMISPGGSANLAQRNVALFPVEGEPCLGNLGARPGHERRRHLGRGRTHRRGDGSVDAWPTGDPRTGTDAAGRAPLLRRAAGHGTHSRLS